MLVTIETLFSSERHYAYARFWCTRISRAKMPRPVSDFRAEPAVIFGFLCENHGGHLNLTSNLVERGSRIFVIFSHVHEMIIIHYVDYMIPDLSLYVLVGFLIFYTTPCVT